MLDLVRQRHNFQKLKKISVTFGSYKELDNAVPMWLFCLQLSYFMAYFSLDYHFWDTCMQASTTRTIKVKFGGMVFNTGAEKPCGNPSWWKQSVFAKCPIGAFT